MQLAALRQQTRATHLLVERRSSGALMLVRDRPGHDLFEVVFVEAGEGHQRVGGRRIRLEAGDLLLVAPWEQRTSEREDAMATWIVAFGAEWLTDDLRLRTDGNTPAQDAFLTALLTLPHSPRPALRIDPSEWCRWITRLGSLAEEVSSGGYACNAAAHALMNLLFIDIARAAQVRQEAAPRRIPPLLLGVFSFIEQRFRAPIGLADVAKAVGRSPSYLTDLVRRETGRTVLQWIIHRRIAEARRLLQDPSVRVKDVATRIGYDDTGHFIRQFRRLNGQTPQQWREVGQAGIRLYAGRQPGSSDQASRASSPATSKSSMNTPRPLAASSVTSS